ANWTTIPPSARPLKQLAEVQQLAQQKLGDSPDATARAQRIAETVATEYRQELSDSPGGLATRGGLSPDDSRIADEVLAEVRVAAEESARNSWGLLGFLGLNSLFASWDAAVRSPFAPFGMSGIMLGATTAFFAYIGFDSVSTQIEEARRPQRDVPLAILASLGVCAVMYVAMTLIVTGMQPYYEIAPEAPFAAAFQHQADLGGGEWLRAAAGLISLGALAALTSVVLMSFLCQTRVFMVMSRDGLLPNMFGDVHDHWRTPHWSTLLVGAGIALSAALTPITTLENLVVIGTLSVFVIVCVAVLVLRVERPDLPRPFRCPLVYVVAPLGVIVNTAMLLFLPVDVWVQFVVWLLIGGAIYLVYGMRHSRAGHPHPADAT
ncbi:MAG TPA: amino acid permease, partial [Pirellulales bacterium]